MRVLPHVPSIGFLFPALALVLGSRIVTAATAATMSPFARDEHACWEGDCRAYYKKIQGTS